MADLKSPFSLKEREGKMKRIQNASFNNLTSYTNKATNWNELLAVSFCSHFQLYKSFWIERRGNWINRWPTIIFCEDSLIGPQNLLRFKSKHIGSWKQQFVRKKYNIDRLPLQIVAALLTQNQKCGVGETAGRETTEPTIAYTKNAKSAPTGFLTNSTDTLQHFKPQTKRPFLGTSLSFWQHKHTSHN